MTAATKPRGKRPPRGRRSRRVVTASRVEQALADMQALRLACIRDGSWPTWSLDSWRARAIAAQLKLDAGESISLGDHHAIQVSVLVDELARKKRGR